MAMEVSSSVICSKCGTAHGRRKNYFLVSYSTLNRGIGYMTVCKECVNAMFAEYMEQCKNEKLAMRQLCRKLDLYWSAKVYEGVEKRSVGQAIAVNYISRLTSSNYAGKCYDDTLIAEGTMWSSIRDKAEEQEESVQQAADAPETTEDNFEITDEMIAFWGRGYTPQMYADLEQRRSYWMSRFPNDIEIDIGTEAIIKQICAVEIDISRDRAAGRAVDKSISVLNTLLGSASLKPAQKKNDSDNSLYNTPMGVWIDRFENKRPIPEDETDKDRNYLTKYILAWFGGHLSKMFGIKNANTKLYEEEIAKYRVYRPDFDDDSDDNLMYDALANVEQEGETSTSIENGETNDEG